jgi:protein O-GlcNAc transferase
MTGLLRLSLTTLMPTPTVAMHSKSLKRYEEALTSYDRAIAIKPDYAEAYYNRGNALQELKRLEEALASYDRAIEIKPDYAEAYSNRGNALKELKRLVRKP